MKEVLSRKVKYYRTLHSMTQEELAMKIGVEPLHISCVERGQKRLGLDKLEIICDCFNITMADLMPVKRQDDSDTKEAWINEIVETLRSLDTSQIGMVKSMIGGLKG